MPRYVILEHDWPTPHQDLMLERDGVLLTWRLASPLIAGEQLVERIADHRLHYLDYEGPVGGNRGSVKRLATGMFAWIKQRDDLFEFHLDGDLQGVLHLNEEREDGISPLPPSLTLRVGITWRLRWEPRGRDEAA
jgi:hypothetical protein